MNDNILAELIDRNVELPPVWVTYPGSRTFKIHVRPVGGRLRDIIAEATDLVWDEALMHKTSRINDGRYLELLGRAAVDGWQGLRPDDLRKLVPIGNPQKLRKMGANEIPFDGEALRLLLAFSAAFRGWLERVIVNMELYNAEREEQAEKK